MRVLLPLLLVAAILLGAVYWDQTPPRADLVIANRGEVFTLDPQRMSYLQDFRLAYALYEGLVRWNNVDLSIEPAAAELPVISDDRRTYTFEIRPNAKWSNGDPVTAHDFVYSWKRLLWPDTAADYSNLLFAIEGAEEFFRWRNEQLAAFARDPAVRSAQAAFDEAERRFAETVGIQAIGDRTLRIRLRRPTPYFLDLICFAVCHPVHRPTVEGWPGSDAAIDRERGWIAVESPPWEKRRFIRLDPATARLEQSHEWARPGNLVGNGPYVLAQWRYKRDLRLERSADFHTPEMVRSRSVLLLSIEDPNTSVLAFESGKIDWLGDVSVEYQADMLDQQRAGTRHNIHALPAFGTDFYSFNCRPRLADGRVNPFAEARVRRAFALAVDKQAIVRNATRLNEPVMNTFIPPGSIPDYRSPAGLAHDATRARAELAAAGWLDRNGDQLIENESGEPFPIIDLLWTTGSSRYKWMSLELKSQWERELGVRVELRGADTKFYKEDLKAGKFMIARGRWYGDYGDPTTFLDINKTGDGNNDRGYSNGAFDRMLEDAAKELDPAARLRLLEDAERFLFEQEMPLLPICQLVQLYMYEPGRLKGLTTHPRLIQYLWQIEASRNDNDD